MRLLLFFATSILLAAPVPPAHTVKPFGEEFPSLDSLAVGAWWEPRPAAKGQQDLGGFPGAYAVIPVSDDRLGADDLL